ncbi:Hypothetical protein FKW44_004627 [Caligus rogercresseyi]|uniref:Uncharacterized protein n=1 Tax=Caligus rogercresseyi TaxID=217165 RepID=A0A7T8HM38_CALRO|nr:Hypothetical protein FKW44_004627 [Caligus rogercresseyi]
MPWTPRNESPPSLPVKDTFPHLDFVNEWSPTTPSSSSDKGVPSLIFVRELYPRPSSS